MSEHERHLDGLRPEHLLAGFVNFTTAPLATTLITPVGRSDVLLRPHCSRDELFETPGLFLERVSSWTQKPAWRHLASHAFENGVPLTIFGGEDVNSLEFLDEATRRLMSGSGAIPKSFLPIAHVPRGLESASPMLIRMGVGLLNLSPGTLGVLGQPARTVQPLLDRSPPRKCGPDYTKYILQQRLPASGPAFSAFGHAARQQGSILVVVADPGLPLSPDAEQQPVLDQLMEWEERLDEPFAAWVILQPQVSAIG